MTIINFMNVEVYNESLELFFKRGLRDYAKKNSNYTLVENGTPGDVTLDIKCRFVEQVRKMSGLKVLYFPDNLYRFGELFDRCEEYYDLIFFAHENDKIDNKRYFHLPVAYDPDTHYQLTKKKTIDVAFVGTAHEGRYNLAKVKGVHIYGNGWSDKVYPVYGVKKRSIYAKTKIMINHHVRGDTSANMRDYEALAMNTFLLSDLIPNELDGGMVQYHGQKHLQSQIVYYLKHKAEREAIAGKGLELVKPHTYESRMAEMVEIVSRWGPKQ